MGSPSLVLRSPPWWIDSIRYELDQEETRVIFVVVLVISISLAFFGTEAARGTTQRGGAGFAS
jgi:hypothetical protein